MKASNHRSSYFDTESDQNQEKFYTSTHHKEYYKENDQIYKPGLISFPLMREVLWDRHPISRPYYLQPKDVIPSLYLSHDAIKKILVNLIEFGRYDGKFVCVDSSSFSLPSNHPATLTSHPAFVITSLDDIQTSRDYYSTSSLDRTYSESTSRIITIPMESQSSSNSLHFDGNVE